MVVGWRTRLARCSVATSSACRPPTACGCFRCSSSPATTRSGLTDAYSPTARRSRRLVRRRLAPQPQGGPRRCDSGIMACRGWATLIWCTDWPGRPRLGGTGRRFSDAPLGGHDARSCGRRSCCGWLRGAVHRLLRPAWLSDPHLAGAPGRPLGSRGSAATGGSLAGPESRLCTSAWGRRPSGS